MVGVGVPPPLLCPCMMIGGSADFVRGNETANSYKNDDPREIIITILTKMAAVYDHF
jgi:hypothetical protein